ncbi:hypothetical protein CON17_08625 [Bacillus thuringiensis]|uniref:hypothetical protein n=1 Tax=Bacillus thuringiensis TaxID=1428 RepID=UPI000BEE2B24|nr:hypothetical protein [Bacillus thuringiensis]MCU5405466.1 hypothetical protein [Bacillus cereus]MCU5510351.1 hypothetical protein [Bacillus cereus]MDA2414742.1 hypothetical protein [Bacillus cereus]MDR4923692.1 hypothetical protein [Bacillus thuringiensis]MED3582809.1 hypothetical protein [Bacillus thuringiensis]
MDLGLEGFCSFMKYKFSVVVDEEQVGEETMLLYKEDLDENLLSEVLLAITPDLVLVHTHVYDTEENEWMVCMVSDANANYPLFLICLKDGEKVYEKLLKK